MFILGLCNFKFSLKILSPPPPLNKIKTSQQIFLILPQARGGGGGAFHADSRKSASKFSGLSWFLLFEDLYNGEGPLQANKTSKKHW